jgi:hypothetical protein
LDRLAHRARNTRNTIDRANSISVVTD